MSSKKTDATRRAIVGATIGVGLGIGSLSLLAPVVSLRPKKEVTPESEPPKEGDLLTFAVGDKAGKVVTFDDLPLEGPAVLAYPKDPKTGVIKSGEKNNLVLLTRFKPDELGDEVKKYSADGAVCYSAICTHLGCTVGEWDAAKGLLLCPCHKGLYDPRHGAEVVSGPPPRPLPVLPIRADGNKPVVAGGFTSQPGVLAGTTAAGGSCAV